MVKINIGEKQKILVGSIVIVLCLIALGFMYQNNLKAYYMGIDVRYLNDPLYCEKGDDCISTNCSLGNKYFSNNWNTTECSNSGIVISCGSDNKCAVLLQAGGES
ncbi:hypothetical protein H6501_04095 [Candidatus Woesearchaeota archaeon]|nr:hypothetical protein [Candidatus Woesearchaeota archaeon]